MFNKLKQFKDMAVMAKKAQELQSMFAQETVVGSSLGDQITITLDGNFNCKDVHVDPVLLTADNQKKVETGIKDAFADAFKKIQSVMATKMKSRMGDMDLTKLMGEEKPPAA